jgi:predicted nucleic acid-binding protein
VTIVLDASVAAAWLVDDAVSTDAATLLDDGEELAAPDLLGTEVANVLWKRLLRSQFDSPTAERLLRYFFALGIRLEPSSTFLASTLRLAGTLRHPVHDCLYLALAQKLGASIATFDKRMAAAAKAAAIPLWKPRRR